MLARVFASVCVPLVVRLLLPIRAALMNAVREFRVRFSSTKVVDGRRVALLTLDALPDMLSYISISARLRALPRSQAIWFEQKNVGNGVSVQEIRVLAE